MATRIRMRKISHTSTGRYNFRIVVTTRSKARDASQIEEIGYYDPSKKPASVKLDTVRYEYWVSKGAEPSNTVRSIYKKLKG